MSAADEAAPERGEARSAALEARLGLPELRFRAGAGGLVFAQFDSQRAKASLCIQGAQLLTWQPRTQVEPVVWLSAAARFEPGRPIRGGIPVCWPWFGPSPTPGLPSHGFARTLDWQPQASGYSAGGDPWLSLQLADDERTRALWPHRFRVELRVTVGAALTVELVTRNTGGGPLRISEALHAYFRVGDIGAVRVEGLEGKDHVDTAEGARTRHQYGPIGFDREVDRVYADGGPECAIIDAMLRRRVVIAKSGSASTIVWNPWNAKAERLGDIGPDERGPDAWRRMVCVESGNARDHTLVLEPGAAHALAVRYQVDSSRGRSALRAAGIDSPANSGA